MLVVDIDELYGLSLHPFSVSSDFLVNKLDFEFMYKRTWNIIEHAALHQLTYYAK